MSRRHLTDHRQAEVGRLAVLASEVGSSAGDIDTTNRVTVDGSLIESRQWAFGHHFLGTQQSLRLRDGDPNRTGCHCSSGNPGLLLLNRPHLVRVLLCLEIR